MKQFTDATAKNAKTPEGKAKTVKAAGNGLYLEVSAKGNKTWKHRYKVAGRDRWYRLGSYPAMSLKEARADNDKIKLNTDRGRKPVNKETINRDSTFNDLYEEWVTKAQGPASKGNKPWSDAHKKNTEYMFMADVLPHIKNLKLKDIHRDDIKGLLDLVENRKAHNQTLQLYRKLRRIFNYAAEERYIDVSPMIHLPTMGRSKAKERFLSESEIRVFIKSLSKANMAGDTARILEIILRTGQRPSEVAGAMAKEFSGDWWSIPSTRTKNKREHRVFITKTVRDLFGAANDDGLYFPSAKDSSVPLNHLVLSKALRRSLTGKEKKISADVTLAIEPFTPHDLRRTCSNFLAKVGFNGETRSAVLNHTIQTVTAKHYTVYDNDDEKQEALETWDAVLESITSDRELESWLLQWLASGMTNKTIEKRAGIWNTANGDNLTTEEIKQLIEKQRKTLERKVRPIRQAHT